MTFFLFFFRFSGKIRYNKFLLEGFDFNITVAPLQLLFERHKTFLQNFVPMSKKNCFSKNVCKKLKKKLGNFKEFFCISCNFFCKKTVSHFLLYFNIIYIVEILSFGFLLTLIYHTTHKNYPKSKKKRIFVGSFFDVVGIFCATFTATAYSLALVF